MIRIITIIVAEIIIKVLYLEFNNGDCGSDRNWSLDCFDVVWGVDFDLVGRNDNMIYHILQYILDHFHN